MDLSSYVHVFFIKFLKDKLFKFMHVSLCGSHTHFKILMFEKNILFHEYCSTFLKMMFRAIYNVGEGSSYIK